MYGLVGEETKNPERAIPMSIFLTLLVCSVVYCSISIVVTLMVKVKFSSILSTVTFFQVPYYLINPDAVLPEAFRYVHLPVFKYIVGVGALTGLSIISVSSFHSS